MIRVTRLDGTPMLVNLDQINWVEFTPDTVISLANGEKLLVRDGAEAILRRVQDYKRDILTPVVGGRRAEPQPLRVVE